MAHGSLAQIDKGLRQLSTDTLPSRLRSGVKAKLEEFPVLEWPISSNSREPKLLPKSSRPRIGTNQLNSQKLSDLFEKSPPAF
ncbi:hypothetical protein VNO77_26004 [Canavalia gladiata]|uniref:Uncharacterized protein n=1 Tax=Canavalia gladiata TaxID=3824 RepID=A0AAN9KRL2_CANGL